MNGFLVRVRNKTMAVRRNFFCWRRFKILLVSAVVLLILINFLVTVFGSNRRRADSNAAAANALKYNESSKWSQFSDTAKYISIEVLSSKDRVRICVDDATVMSQSFIVISTTHTVIDDSGASSNRGMHVVVLNQHTGMVMAQRVFDTYMDDEPLIGFLDRVTTGRIIIFAVKDEASFHLTEKGKRAMQIHIGGGSVSTSKSESSSTAGGSLWLSELGWRDMWAIVAKHQNNYLKIDRDPNSFSGHVYGESYSHNPGLMMQLKNTALTSLWGSDVMLRVQVPLDVNHSQNNQNDDGCESWKSVTDTDDSNEDRSYLIDNDSIIDDDKIIESQLIRRRRFCSRIEGYGNVCSCIRPAPLDFHPLPIPDSTIDRVPVIIIAANRADYLYRTLKSVLKARGVQRNMVTVHVDGYYDEPVEVARLLGVRAVQHMPAVGDSVNGGSGGRIISNSGSSSRRRRVTQHYKSALTNTFSVLFPQAEYAIVLEDDLEVSVDFFSFFSQTLPLLAATDDSVDGSGSSSLYCISAWNDQGYEHTASRPDVLYRVDWMPGLGWMIKRSLYKDQLESEWPTIEKPWDWDMWMRTNKVQRGRQCIVPEVSRTYHFGSSRAVNVNPYFQRAYFGRHAFYNHNVAGGGQAATGSNSGGTGGEYDDGRDLINFKDIDKMTQATYLNFMERKIMIESQLLDHSKWPCRKKHWDNDNAKNRGRYAEDNRIDEEFFIIDEMMNNDHSIRSKKLFILYIQMDDPINNNEAASEAWKPLAKCLGIWDLDIRGHYKGMWRLYLNREYNENQDYSINAEEEGIPAHSKIGTELFIISCPFSYFCKFKPANVTAVWYNSVNGGEDDDGEDDRL